MGNNLLSEGELSWHWRIFSWVLGNYPGKAFPTDVLICSSYAFSGVKTLRRCTQSLGTPTNPVGTGVKSLPSSGGCPPLLSTVNALGSVGGSICLCLLFLKVTISISVLCLLFLCSLGSAEGLCSLNLACKVRVTQSLCRRKGGGRFGSYNRIFFICLAYLSRCPSLRESALCCSFDRSWGCSKYTLGS